MKYYYLDKNSAGRQSEMEKARKAKLNIGSLSLPSGLVLAPMAGFSDRTFRALCMSHGADFSVSEMVCAKALCYEQKCRKTDEEHFKTGALAAVMKEDLPMALQLFGSEPEFIAEAVSLIVNRSYKSCKSDALPSAIDINMGCPVHKIVSNGEGSALMKDPLLAGKITEAAVKALSEGSSSAAPVKRQKNPQKHDFRLSKIMLFCRYYNLCVDLIWKQ